MFPGVSQVTWAFLLQPMSLICTFSLMDSVRRQRCYFCHHRNAVKVSSHQCSKCMKPECLLVLFSFFLVQQGENCFEAYEVQHHCKRQVKVVAIISITSPSICISACFDSVYSFCSALISRQTALL